MPERRRGHAQDAGRRDLGLRPDHAQARGAHPGPGRAVHVGVAGRQAPALHHRRRQRQCLRRRAGRAGAQGRHQGRGRDGAAGRAAAWREPRNDRSRALLFGQRGAGLRAAAGRAGQVPRPARLRRRRVGLRDPAGRHQRAVRAAVRPGGSRGGRAAADARVAAGGAGLALLVLATATAGLAFNLARGRRDMDCGCSGPMSRRPGARGTDCPGGWWRATRRWRPGPRRCWRPAPPACRAACCGRTPRRCSAWPPAPSPCTSRPTTCWLRISSCKQSEGSVTWMP